jgi:two-component system response regulator AtoC
MKPSILIVDDETRLAEVLALALGDRDMDANAVGSVEEAEAFFQANSVDLVLTDLRMPEFSGRDLLHRIRQSRPDVPVVIMTAYTSVRDAVELVKEGAFDYISKPFEIEDLVLTIERALNLREAVQENRRLRGELEEKYRFDHLIGESPAFQQVLRSITEVCGSRATVLIHGQSGTGKELVARAIHYNSPRCAKPFIAVNCAAIPEALLESELFGHTKGAFTGAISAREGRFAAAHGGTLFLDEIGDMPLSAQAKVLRAIQEQAFEPIGSNKKMSVEVRILAATHKDLRRMVAEREFREDLYYRLNVFPMTLPALRERQEDIPLLARHFLRVTADDMGKKLVGFTPGAEAAMAEYDWPGNIRELQNCVERAVIVVRSATIDVQDLPWEVLHGHGMTATPSPQVPQDLDAEMERLERSFIIEALKGTGGVQVRAAERLGISERSFWHRVKKLGIRIDRSVQ